MLSCPICHEGITDSTLSGNHPWVLSCGHIYHKHCITESLLLNNTCPLCGVKVQRGFRLYPEHMEVGDTIAFLQDCVQSAEQQCANLCNAKDTRIREVEKTLESTNSNLEQLRASHIIYSRGVARDIAQLEADKQTLQQEKAQLDTDKQVLLDDMESLYRELDRSAALVAHHKATISTLQTELEDEKEQSKADRKARLATEHNTNQKLHALTEQVKQAQQARDEALDELLERDDEISDLRTSEDEMQAKLDDLASHVEILQHQLGVAYTQIKHLSERPPQDRADETVDALATHFEGAIINGDESPSRKRNNEEDLQLLYNNSLCGDEETRGKQQRSEPGGDTQPTRDDDTGDSGVGAVCEPPQPRPESPDTALSEGKPSKGPKKYFVRKVFQRRS